MSDEEYRRWGDSAEEWRCEDCDITKARMEASTVKGKEERGSGEAMSGNSMLVSAVEHEEKMEGELDGEREKVDTWRTDKTSCRKTARIEAVANTVEKFTKRVTYKEEEVVETLQEQYRATREQQGARDTNVTQSVRSMKGEVLEQLGHEGTKDRMINVEMLLQQWPNLGELVLHLVRRVEDLEATVAFKDRRMEVLAKKIQLLEKGRTESEPYLLADRNGVHKPTEMLEGNKTEPQKELEKSDKKDQDLIGDPVILRRRWSTRPKKGGKAISSHEKKGESSGCVWSKNWNKWTKQSKNENKWTKQSKNGNRWPRNVTTNNWEKKRKVAKSVENKAKNSRLRVNSTEGSRNTEESSMRKHNTQKEDVKWSNERLDKLQETITSLEKLSLRGAL